MSFQNPFSNLIRREYNVTNIKKILDTFPTSLRVEQLTSTQLLEVLRNTIQDKDITIEELLERLANREQTSDDLSGINETLQGLTQELNLGSVVEDTVARSQLDAKVQALLSQGYKQIGDTPLYVLVDKGAAVGGAEFNMNHTRENDGFPESDLKSPSELNFVNVSETEDVWFIKKELWTDDEDGFASKGRFDGNPFAPTNVFRFTDYPNAHARAYKILKNTDTSTSVQVNYKSKDAYSDAGLKRNNETNTWFGFMNFRAIVGSTPDGIGSTQSTDIGKMRLYRDRT